jgi:plastocyanin
MKRSALFLVLCCVPAWAFPTADSGTIEGRILFTGNVPPPKKFLTTDGSVLLHSDIVVHPKTKGLRHVVVVLEDAAVQPKVEKADPVLVDQRDMVFLPRVVAIQHGRVVRFENNDLFNHGVTAFSTVASDQFNVLVPANQPLEHIFSQQKNPIQIGCVLHPWMRAWIYVVPHPWFAVSDADGKFKIDKVPPGKHTLWLRHPDTGYQERHQVEVRVGEIAELKLKWQQMHGPAALPQGSAGLSASGPLARHDSSSRPGI